MAKSPFFARIKTDVLRIAAAVPSGRVVSFSDIGQHLDVAPRHVAYIMATLTADERAAVPWHRVVPASGQLGRRQLDGDGVSQSELLEAEGIEIDASGGLRAFAERLVAVHGLAGVGPRQVRPDDAPKPARRRSPGA